jgi:DNA-directed RNA polymerase subunit RPC12/RpoP
MKIVVKNKPQELKKWWVGRVFSCTHCGSEILLETDADAVVTFPRGDTTTVFKCPVCGAQVNIDRFRPTR